MSGHEGTKVETNRAGELLDKELHAVRCRTDRLFFGLLIAQWVFAIAVAFVFSPYGWTGKVRALHKHVETAILLGAVINALPLYLIWTRPGWWLTRHVAAGAQMLWSALLIHLSGGRIETHFHVFGSLAFVSFYRDWRVLPTATVVVAGDHLIRGILWPESVYGIPNPEWWRFLEHAFWVIFEDAVLVLYCLRGVRDLRELTARQGELEKVNAGIEKKVIDRTAELDASRRQFQALVESVNGVPWEMDVASLRFTYVGPQAETLLGFLLPEWRVPGFFADRLHPDDKARVVGALKQALDSGRGLDVEYRLVAREGGTVFARNIVTVRDYHGKRVLRGLILDQTKRKQLEMELQQAQKLESVGRLAAGIAHEINTPIQFINDSVHFIRDAMGDLSAVVERYQKLRHALETDARWQADAQALATAEDEADVPYLMENAPPAIDRSIQGLSRVASIVRSMKEFAHPDQEQQALADVNKAVENTLTIARNEYKYVADVKTELGEMPQVVCHLGDLNQVILNVVVNAAHAIADVSAKTGERGRIVARTWRDGEQAVIAISDTGGGIPEAIRDRIFDPFFTTKAVGRGMGQGLAISRTAIVEKHGGTLTFETEVGKGTTFLIRLPIAGKKTDKEAA